MSSPTIVAAKEFKQAFTNDSPLVIDVRSAREFEAFHLKGVVNIPLTELSSPPLKAMLEAAKLNEKAVYILCHSGKRAEAAAKKMASYNGGSYFVVRGGTLACDDYGMEIIRSNNKVLAKRRLRIILGFMGILGVALGFAIHKGFYGLSVVIGAGLIVSRITEVRTKN